MKKISILALALVLTMAMLTGCGCRNSKPANTVPTVQPTMRPTTEATTAPTSAPATQPGTDATIEDGNGPLGTDMTNATAGADGNTNDTTGAAGRSRRMPMG